MVQKRKPAKFYSSRYILTGFAVQGVNKLFKCKEDHRSYRRNFCSCEKKAPQKFRLVRDSNPSPGVLTRPRPCGIPAQKIEMAHQKPRRCAI